MKDGLDKIIEQAVYEELEDIQLKYGNAYNTLHEGYAVMKEEVEECEEDLTDINNRLRLVWGAVRKDEASEDYLQLIKKYAVNLACEAVQVAAVAQKFIDSFKDGDICE